MLESICNAFVTTKMSFVSAIRNAWIILNFYRKVLHINYLDEFDVDFAVTIVTFETRSMSNWFISSIIIHELLPAST